MTLYVDGVDKPVKMPKREFERAKKRALRYWANPKKSSEFNWLMDDLVMECSDEQWAEVETMLADAAEQQHTSSTAPHAAGER